MGKKLVCSVCHNEFEILDDSRMGATPVCFSCSRKSGPDAGRRPFGEKYFKCMEPDKS